MTSEGRSLPCEPHPGWCYVHDHEPKAGRLSSDNDQEVTMDNRPIKPPAKLFSLPRCEGCGGVAPNALHGCGCTPATSDPFAGPLTEAPPDEASVAARHA